jgi:hypothetical protein
MDQIVSRVQLFEYRPERDEKDATFRLGPTDCKAQKGLDDCIIQIVGHHGRSEIRLCYRMINGHWGVCGDV